MGTRSRQDAASRYIPIRIDGYIVFCAMKAIVALILGIETTKVAKCGICDF